MRLITIFLLSTISMFLIAQDTQAETQHHKNGSDETIAELNLNNGQKWDMAPHMAKLIIGMEQTLALSDQKSLEDLKATGEQMKASIEKLVSSCSMTGPAHDNLHAFLSVYIPTVHQLADATAFEDAEQVALKLKAYFKVYNTHFK